MENGRGDGIAPEHDRESDGVSSVASDRKADVASAETSFRTDSSKGPDHFDAIVIGGGSAGLAFAKRAADNGARVAMIEMAELGGTCVNRGCVPKKLLWHLAHTQREEEVLTDSGHVPAPPRLDFAHVERKIAGHIESIRESFGEALSEKGVEFINARARCRDARTVECDGRILSTDRLVLATGSKPDQIDVPGADLCEVSHDVFDWREVPERILILGGGYIGTEFSTIFSGLGSNVTLAETGDEILEGFDPDAVRIVRKNLEDEGVRVVTGAALASVARAGNSLSATLDTGEVVACDKVVAVVGRSPRVGALGSLGDTLEKAESGALAISDTFETTEPGVYAIGDVADRMPLTPVARRDGEWLADHLFGEAGERLDLDLVATVTFSDPPIAQVGRTQGDDLEIVLGSTSPLADGLIWQNGVGRDGSTYFHKIARCPKSGKVQGMAIISDAAANEISWAAAAIAAGADKTHLAKVGSVHPTSTEEFIG